MAENFNKKLIEILNNYKSIAVDNHKKIPFSDYEKYYYGTDKKTHYNIVKFLIDTKKTFILDNHITTSVIAKTINYANRGNIEDMQDMADVLEDSKNEVFNSNKIEELYKRVVRRGLTTNIGIVKVYWDQEESELGDVKIDEINPNNFYPDPNGENVNDCNYIFIKKHISVLTLKKKYPDKIKEIEKLVNLDKKDESKNIEKKSDRKITGIITTTTDQRAAQLYSYEQTDVDGIKSQGDTLTIWECYIKDDSLFVEEEKDTKTEKKAKLKAKLKYPYGRLILYAGEETIFEDKPIDYPYGYPFSLFYETFGDSIMPLGGMVKDLKFIQDRLNKAYERLIYLLGKYLSLVVIDEASGVTATDIVDADTLSLNPESLTKGQMPKILTNNTIAEIGTVTQYIQELKNNAYEISRVNPQMISGERPKGVTSGDMVIALNESALTGIRDLQRNFMGFVIDLTDKVLVLIQKYYNLERYVRISTTEIIKFPLRGEEEQEEEQPGIQRLKIEKKEEKDGNVRAVTDVVNDIKSDPLDYEFKTEIIAGSKLPKSRTQYAQLTMNLVNQGIFGDINSLTTKKLVLDSLDYPNRRAILTELEEKQKELAKTPPIVDTAALVEKLGLSFKDLSEKDAPFSEPQRKLLEKWGLLLPKEESLPVEEQPLTEVYDPEELQPIEPTMA